MTDIAAAPLADTPQFDPVAGDGDVRRWPELAADLRFFLICYLAGLIVFLVMLS